ACGASWSFPTISSSIPATDRRRWARSVAGTRSWSISSSGVDLTPPRGMQDFLPPAGGRVHALYDAASDIAELYGYRYVETPDVEHTELFLRTSGETSDVVSKEMYTFTDRGRRSVTL